MLFQCIFFFFFDKCVSLNIERVYVCVCVCNLAFLHHQLVNCPSVWSSDNESDPISDKRDGFTGRQQLIGWACDSPLHAWAPPDRCTPTHRPPPFHSLYCRLFLQLACRPKHTLAPPCQARPEKLWNPGARDRNGRAASERQRGGEERIWPQLMLLPLF